MATDNTDIVLPTVGADEDTWGDENNTALSAIDACLATRFPRFLEGLTLSTAGASATFAVAAGVANDSTNAKLLRLAAAISKTTSAWAVGSTNGGLDASTIENDTWYHAYLIKRLDTGVVDVVFSKNASAPALPTNYTVFRRIGSLLTNGSAQWTAFIQNGDDFEWKVVPAFDYNNNPTAATPFLQALTVPLGIIVKAKIGMLSNTANGGIYAWNPALGTLVAPGVAQGGAANPRVEVQVYTNTSKQVYFQSDDTALMRIETHGWTDARGR
jgi:hypothetical protein